MLSGADRDLRDGAGRTPIALAAAAGQEECVEGGLYEDCVATQLWCNLTELHECT